MNRPLQILLLILLSVPAMAQFTVTQSNFPRQASFTDTMVSTTQSGIQLPSEGSAQVWDYSDLNTNNISTSVHADATTDPVFTDALNSFQADFSFLGLNVPARMFEAVDGNGFHMDGMSISEINYPLTLTTANPNDSIRFIQRDDIYQGRINPIRFPCSYLIQWSGTHEQQLDFSLTLTSASLAQAPGFRKRTITDDRDVLGFGKLVIPDFSGGSTDSIQVLQIKVTQEIVDSFYLQGSPAPDSVLAELGLTQGSIARDTMYVFYRAEFTSPVLELHISGNAVSSAIFRPQADNVVSTGIADKYSIAGMKYYPNPISSGRNLNIEMPNSNLSTYHVTLVDMLGRQLSATSITDQTQTQLEIPAGTQPGIYLVLITDEAGAIADRSKLLVR